MRWSSIYCLAGFTPLCVWAGSCPDLLKQTTILLEAKNFTAAISELERAPENCRKDEIVMVHLARAYLLAQQFERSLEASNRLLELYPRSVNGLRVKADAHYLLGQDAEAEAALTRALSIEPENLEAIYSLGRVYYYRSRYQQALEQFEKLTALDPGSYKGWDNLGLAQEGVGQSQQAIRSYLRAIELVAKAHPGYDWPYTNLASLLLKQGENRKAFDVAVEAATRNPASAQNCYLAAKALTKLGQWDKSVRWLERSIELDPTYPTAHYLLAQVYRRLDRAAEGEKEFLRFRELRDKAPNRAR